MSMLGSARGSSLTTGVAIAGDRRWLRQYVACLLAIDAGAATVASATAYAGRFGSGELAYARFSILFPAMWLCAVGLARAYEARFLGMGSDEFQRVFHAFVALTALVGFLSFALKAEVARGYVILALPIAAASSLVARYAARRRLHALRRRGRCMQNVLAIGGEHSILDLVTQLRRDAYCGMRVVAACLAAGRGDQLSAIGVPVLPDLNDVATQIRRFGAQAVAVTSCAEIDPARLRRLAWELEGTDVELVVAPGLMEVAGPRLHIRPVAGLPLLHVEEPKFTGAGRLAKGLVDRVVAILALVLLAPLLLAIALAVRLTTPGPALFRQTRIGKDGREFKLFKFRSMFQDAEARRASLLSRNERAEGLLFKIRDDPRITPLGRVLRRGSLDEMPQLLNVALGHMSLVGPRPPLPEEAALYEDDVRRRLLVKPGLTGLWQISGRSDLTWEESVRLDLRYVENWSMTLDLMIMWKTLFAVLRGNGAY